MKARALGTVMSFNVASSPAKRWKPPSRSVYHATVRGDLFVVRLWRAKPSMSFARGMSLLSISAQVCFFAMVAVSLFGFSACWA
jgi:hypothetical protein